METIRDWWFAIINSTPNWDLILRFLDVLIWPFIVLTGLLLSRPWRVIDRILENGGEVAAAGVTMRIASTIEDVADAVSDEPDAPESVRAEIPSVTSVDPYKRIMDSWGRLSDEIYRAVNDGSGDQVSRRDPGQAVDVLLQRKLIGRRLAKAIRELLSVRNEVKRYGRSKFQKMELSDDDIEKYSHSAVRAANTLRNRHRDRVTAPALATQGGQPSAVH